LAPAKSFPADQSGLYDFVGNVSEWMHDSYTLMPPPSDKIETDPLGQYSYMKLLDNGVEVPCIGLLFAVHTRLLKTEYPEANERDRKWFSRKKAAKRVDEPDLAALIRTFDPRQLG
ncbi:MAG: SUMF1/EgtB/PvdO family nonheme iron enzyme, partial [Pseudomonadota bacterium]|nr:SUMF1/EgtB/PvdO family nonheme iron enzyme [Pseudomonadota bacterium]